MVKRDLSDKDKESFIAKTIGIGLKKANSKTTLYDFHFLHSRANMSTKVTL
jgi:hypothetical protein